MQKKSDGIISEEIIYSGDNIEIIEPSASRKYFFR